VCDTMIDLITARLLKLAHTPTYLIYLFIYVLFALASGITVRVTATGIYFWIYRILGSDRLFIYLFGIGGAL
jgi:hypothetical protein